MESLQFSTKYLLKPEARGIIQRINHATNPFGIRSLLNIADLEIFIVIVCQIFNHSFIDVHFLTY